MRIIDVSIRGALGFALMEELKTKGNKQMQKLVAILEDRSLKSRFFSFSHSYWEAKVFHICSLAFETS